MKRTNFVPPPSLRPVILNRPNSADKLSRINECIANCSTIYTNSNLDYPKKIISENDCTFVRVSTVMLTRN